MKHTVKVTETEYIIPELEELAKTYIPTPRLWTSREDGVLSRYMDICDAKDITEFLPGRTVGAVKKRISLLKERERAKRKEND